MAGDWLKFEVDTPEKPEVFDITVAMGWEDPDLTVGKLLKVWRWFDKHTIDGNATRVTLPLLDRVCGVTGFAQAMVDVGWLLRNGEGVSLPNFDRHNGKTAKDRCLTAKRVAKHKANAGGNAASVSGALPREEKNREEQKQEPKTIGAGAPLAGVVVEQRQDVLDAIEHQLQANLTVPTPVPAAKPGKTVKSDMPSLPDWMPMESWDGYIEMRKARKKPPTPRAVELLIGVLGKMRDAGHDIAAILDTSTKNCWTDVYLPKGGDQLVPGQRNGDRRNNGRPSINSFALPGMDDGDDPFDTLRRANP